MDGESAEGTPRRGIALLFGIFGPWGTGHFYLGQTRRALVWLLLSSLLLIGYVLAIPSLGGLIGYRAVCELFLFFLLVPWVGSMIDLGLLPAERFRPVAWNKAFGYWVIGTIFSVFLRVPMRILLIESFKIPSGSMIPTLLVGDHIFVDKRAYHTNPPRRGEVLVFVSPEHPDQDFVKRVLAVPGDKLEVKQGHPWINGWEVPHCLVGKATLPEPKGAPASGELHLEFLDREAYLVFFDEQAAGESLQGPYVVPEHEVWVMGDNRHNSNDSRQWFGGRGGGLPLPLIKGRALFRWLSLLPAGVDGSRFGTSIAAPLLPTSLKSLEAPLQKCLSQRPDKTLPPAAK